LGKPVPLRKQWLDGVDCAAGSAVLCENVRFNKGEKQDDEQLSRRMAALCEVFVMDAFGTAHRAEASTHGVARYAPVACAGPLLEKARTRGTQIVLPTDVVVGREFAATAHADVRPVSEVRAADMILDIGPDTADRCSALLQAAGTIIWNGPVGVFEFAQFGEGTRVIALGVARGKAFSLAGGGDTLAAIEKYGVEDGISYISTGGGAF